ncbi:hypothetical protein PJL15_03613 [Paenarthrobacter nitroguajacolicus]|nr:hypothetical protein [Paenarthrobacter nitroguajacolicus]
MFDAHREDPGFGYRLLVDEARAAGERMSERTAWRTCADNGWCSVFGKKRRKTKKAGPPVHDDLCAVTHSRGRARHDGSEQVFPMIVLVFGPVVRLSRLRQCWPPPLTVAASEGLVGGGGFDAVPDFPLDVFLVGEAVKCFQGF